MVISMPANRTVASLTIALIVFVMLTFVLAITTYLFFKQRLDEAATAAASSADKAKALADLNAATEEKRKLLELLGFPEDKTVAQVEAETNARFAGEFNGFDAETKTYLKLVDWLAEAIRKKESQMDAQRLDHEKAIADKDKTIDSEKSAAAKAVEEREKVAQDAANEKRKFDESRGLHEKQQQDLTAKRDQAQAESAAFQKLKDEVAKGGQFLDPNQQKDFDEKKTDPEGQLDVLFKALRGRAKVIEKQNEMLATLRGGDPAVQAAVLASMPQDDRIDGFDGHVIAVNEGDRTVLISCRSTRGMRPGLLLPVYDPADPRPQVGDRKGLVEVIAVEGPTVARARIRQDSVRNQILGGDGVATSLWSPGQSPEVVVVGFVQLDGDAAPEADALQAAVERIGGRLGDAVTPSTTLVVDAGLPKIVAGADEKIPGWKKNVDEKRRKREIDAARQFGVRVVGIEEMLDLLGLERADVEEGRLPARGDDGRSLPRRQAGVAY
jgi:hypothetical protein